MVGSRGIDVDDRSTVFFGVPMSIKYRAFGEVGSVPMTTNCESESRRTAHPTMSTIFEGNSITRSDVIPTASRPLMAFLVYDTTIVAGFSSIYDELDFVSV